MGGPISLHDTIYSEFSFRLSKLHAVIAQSVEEGIFVYCGSGHSIAADHPFHALSIQPELHCIHYIWAFACFIGIHDEPEPESAQKESADVDFVLIVDLESPKAEVYGLLPEAELKFRHDDDCSA